MKENWALLFAMYRWGKLREEIKVDQDGNTDKLFGDEREGSGMQQPEPSEECFDVYGVSASSV